MADRRVGVLLAAIALSPLFMASGSACNTHRCDDPKDIPHPMARVDDSTYETGPIDGVWLDYGPLQGYLLQIPSTRPVISIEPYVSVAKDQREEGSNFSLAAGDLAIIHDVRIPENTSFTQIHIKSRTCAQYYFRAVVRLAPPAQDAGATE